MMHTFFPAGCCNECVISATWTRILISYQASQKVSGNRNQQITILLRESKCILNTYDWTISFPHPFQVPGINNQITCTREPITTWLIVSKNYINNASNSKPICSSIHIEIHFTYIKFYCFSYLQEFLFIKV